MVAENVSKSLSNNPVGHIDFQKIIVDLRVSPNHIHLLLMNRQGVPLHPTVEKGCGLFLQVELKQPHSCAFSKTILVTIDLEPLKVINDRNEIITHEGSITHLEIKPFVLLGNLLSYL